jgi:hypothetical protein
MSSREWKLGEQVFHAGRPEWGVGEIRSAEAAVQDGTKCQRLTIRFDRAGVKTLTTAFADLRPATQMTRLEAEVPDDGAGWLNRAEAVNPVVGLTELPEVATDPFRTKRARLEATLGLYPLHWRGRFAPGLGDPAVRPSRPAVAVQPPRAGAVLRSVQVQPRLPPEASGLRDETRGSCRARGTLCFRRAFGETGVEAGRRGTLILGIIPVNRFGFRGVGAHP